MEHFTETHLTVRQLARHWGVSTKTIYNLIGSGALPTELFGQYWIAWPDVWAQEQGRRPRAGQEARYRTDLLSRLQLAELASRSLSTVDRWLREGLPTRNVGHSVRINEADAREWLNARYGIKIF